MLLKPTTKSWEVPEIEFLGDEGQYAVCFGHVDERFFVMHAIVELAKIAGLEVAYDMLGDITSPYSIDLNGAVDEVRQTWATEHDDDAGEPFLRWDKFAESDLENNFPVTVWEMW